MPALSTIIAGRGCKAKDAPCALSQDDASLDSLVCSTDQQIIQRRMLSRRAGSEVQRGRLHTQSTRARKPPGTLLTRPLPAPPALARGGPRPAPHVSPLRAPRCGAGRLAGAAALDLPRPRHGRQPLLLLLLPVAEAARLLLLAPGGRPEPFPPLAACRTGRARAGLSRSHTAHGALEQPFTQLSGASCLDSAASSNAQPWLWACGGHVTLDPLAGGVVRGSPTSRFKGRLL